MQKRRQRLEEAPLKAQQAAQQAKLPYHRYSIAEEKGGRVRKPTAIMRSNVEVARLMGMPGSKQRTLSQDDIEAEKPAPQHLSTTRREAKGTTAAEEAAMVSKGCNGAASGDGGEERPRSAGGRSAGRRPQADGSNSGRGGGGFGSRPLPVVLSVPSVLVESAVLTNAVVQAVLPPGIPSTPDGSAPSPARRLITASLVRGGGESSTKRKRRPPGWLAEHEQQGDDEGMEGLEEAEGGGGAPPSSAGSASSRASAMSKKRQIASVVASIAHNQGAISDDPATFATNGGSGPVALCAVAVIGVLPPPAARSRGAMAPPLGGPATAAVTERSPRRQHSSDGPQSGEKEKGSRERSGGGGERRPQKDARETSKDAVSDDAFSFGDLPSPRIIEVVRPKEIHLPKWRLIAPGHLPPPLRAEWKVEGGSGRRRAAAQGRGNSTRLGEGGSSSSSSSSKPDGGGAAAGEGDGDDGSSDEVYERRHGRTLERAIAAARSVARMLAQKERQKQQQASSSDSKAGNGHKPAADARRAPLTEEEEWRFRPSELAALCAAQRMSLDGDGSEADLAALDSAGSTAGFFGRMGGNRGGREANREVDDGDESDGGGERAAEGAAAERLASKGSAASSAGAASSVGDGE